MNFLDPMFVILTSSGTLFILLGAILYKKPPKEINFMYGYRTLASMKSQDRWDFAQVTSATEKIKTGIIMWLCAAIGMYLDMSEALSVFGGLAIMIVLSLMPSFTTERALMQEFGPVEETSPNENRE